MLDGTKAFGHITIVSSGGVVGVVTLLISKGMLLLLLFGSSTL